MSKSGHYSVSKQSVKLYGICLCILYVCICMTLCVCVTTRANLYVSTLQFDDHVRQITLHNQNV